jgi:hypothetical protein
MEIKHTLILLFISAIIVVLGALFKIMHWPGANMMFIVGGLINTVCLVLLIYKLLTKEKTKDFLNS